MLQLDKPVHRVTDNVPIVVNDAHILYFEVHENGVNVLHLTNGQKIRIWQTEKYKEIENGEV